MDWHSIFDEMDRRNIKNLLLEIKRIIKFDIGENNYFNIDLIINILKQKKIEFDENKIHIALYMLLNDFGDITRHDNWSGKTKFQVLDERHRNTTWQKTFYELNDDDKGNKKFILIADTHIGNKNMQNFKLINNIYEFAQKKKIKNIFHLGDVFEGIKCNDSTEEKMKKIDEQLNLFEKYYPKLNPDEIRTIALLGNHDITIHGAYGTDVIFVPKNNKEQLYDLRTITKDNPGFIFYQRKDISIKLNSIPIHLSHRLYLNQLHRSIKYEKIQDITEKTNETFCTYPLYLSAHLHKKLIVESADKYNNKQLFVSVPSTSLLNIEDAVAYIININSYENNHIIEITTINSTSDSEIKIGEEYIYKIENEGFDHRKIKSYNRKYC